MIRRRIGLVRVIGIGAIALSAISIVAVNAEAQPAKLYGKVAVIMKNGDVKPVAKRDFCLTKTNLWELFDQLTKEAEKKYGPLPDMKIRDRRSVEEFFEYGSKLDKHRRPPVEDAYRKAVSQGECFPFKTEFDGSYSVENIPPGKYWVISYPNRDFDIEIGKAEIRWALPIILEPGATMKLDLSNENAANIYNSSF